MPTHTLPVETFRIGRTAGTLRCDFTKLSRITFATIALKVTFFRLDAGGAVEARRRLTLVDDLVAVVAAKAWTTLACVRSVVVEADAVVLARIPCALIDVALTQIARVAGACAVAREAGDLVDADAIVLTRLRFALVQVRLTPRAVEALQAETLEGFAVRRNATCSVIGARIPLAEWIPVDGRLAVFAGEVVRAETFVVADAVHLARAAVARILLAR